jgi:hypothetical protein
LDKPTTIKRLAKLIPVQPTVHGAHDAAKPGAGGVLLPIMPHAIPRCLLCLPPGKSPSPPPVLWRFPFPTHIQRQLATADHSGLLTNSNLLELAGALLQHKVAAQCGGLAGVPFLIVILIILRSCP